MEIVNTGSLTEEQLKKIRHADYIGRGLGIVKRFIAGMGCKLEVSSDETTSTFRIKLPTVE